MIIRTILALLVLVIGVTLAVGGVFLVGVGGSWGYVVLGSLLALSGGLLLAKRGTGLIVYALALLFALGWGLWEVGLDWWALAPRGGLLVLLGLLLLLPPVVRPLRAFSFNKNKGGSAPGGYGIGAAGLGGAVAVAVVIAIAAMLTDTHAIDDAFAPERMAAAPEAAPAVDPGEWSAYGRTSAGLRYSPLDQITRDNVDQLEVAWTYHAGDVHADLPGTALESTPLVVDDTMYLCTPKSQLIALDPVTGEERWRFNPYLTDMAKELATYTTCRGLSYDNASGAGWAVSDAPPPGEEAAQALVRASIDNVTTKAAGVSQNIVAGTAQPGDPNPRVTQSPRVTREEATGPDPVRPDCLRRVFLPTRDARLIAVSATSGTICPGFGGDDGTVNLWQHMPNVTPGAYYSTSPPLVAGDVIVVSGGVNDNLSTTLPSGVIRAFDLRTGALRWNFDPEKPGATAPLAPGETYTANAPNSWSVASYDPDLGLVYLPMGNTSPDQYGANRSENAETYTTSILALDVATGEPAWAYQTVHHDLWDMDVPAQPSLVDLKIDGETVPALVQPTKQGEIFVLDRRTGEPVHPVEEVAAPGGAIADDEAAPTQPVSAVSFNPPPLSGADMWGMTPIDQMLCRISFHKLRYEGRYTPPSEGGTLVYPGNFGVFNWGAVAVDPVRQIMFGMPVYLAFTSELVPRPNELEPVVSRPDAPLGDENFGAPFAAIMKPFMSAIGLPCQRPPWGYIAGVDLVSGETVYRRVNGTVRDVAPVPLPFKTGVPGIGGPIVTRGGLAFLSGTVDYFVRGYDLASGEVLWRARLPAGGQATPATYLGRDGRQYLVVVAGGHGYIGTKLGDSVIAYALPAASG